VKRVVVTLLLVAAAGVGWIALTGAGSDSGKNSYWARFDSAFGLIEGGDLKIAGVRAGQITDIKLDRPSNKALVGFRIDRKGFGSLRTDVFCESRPQSLIGEYFVDCQPGTARTELKPGSVIPVTHTASTVAPDLVNDILRRPYRERLSLIIGSLGAGVAGNAESLNAAIRRASPALRETDRVLATLAQQNRVLRDLTVDADRVVGDLAANRKDVGRFVTEARDTAQASAERRADIAAGLRELPGFLEELQPTMQALGHVADDQRTALHELDASSTRLTDLFDELGPFADASRPAFQSLGQASKTGDRAVRAAPPVIDQLASFTKGTPELGRNLAIVLEHLDDRKHAVEKDPRSPGGQGYSGLEALLQYVYDQTTSTAIFDQSNHILKIGAFVGPCAPYASEETLRKDPSLESKCGSRLGPTQPGLNYPDMTRRATPAQARERGARKRADGDRKVTEPQVPPPTDVSKQQPQQPAASPETPATPPTPGVPLPKVDPGQPSVPPPSIPGVPLPPLPGLGGGQSGSNADERSSDDQTLLDYLLKP
jgi:virulence factor Mce-like protein